MLIHIDMSDLTQKELLILDSCITREIDYVVILQGRHSGYNRLIEVLTAFKKGTEMLIE